MTFRPCANCGREKQHHGVVCNPCREYKATYGVDRPLELEQKRLEAKCNDTGQCTNCKRPINNKNQLCHTCRVWSLRHNGEIRPVKLEQRLTNPKLVKKEKKKICGRCRYKRIKTKNPNVRCQSCITKQAWKDGVFDNCKNKPRSHWWGEIETERLRELVGTISIKQITEILNKEFGCNRSVDAVKSRTKRLEASYEVYGTYSASQVCYMLGICHIYLLKIVSRGLIKYYRTEDTAKREWHFERKDLEDFVRQYPYLLETNNEIRDKKLKRIYDEEYARNPWLSQNEAARILGMETSNIAYHIRKGRLETVPEFTGDRDWYIYYVTRKSLREFAAIRREQKLNGTRRKPSPTSRAVACTT